jgi:hypothetical protein
MQTLVLKGTGRTAKFILSILVDPKERFVGTFVKLRKGTIRFVMSVCPSVRLSVRMEELGIHSTDFH